MLYRQFRPDPRLAGQVHCLWHLRRPAAATAIAPDRVLPDGCMELVFHRATPLRLRTAAGAFERQAQAMLVGQISTHVLLHTDEAAEVVAVRFRPAGARAFFPEDSDAFTDRCVSLDDVGGGWRELANRVADAASAERALALIQAALLRRLARSPAAAPRALGALRLFHQAEIAPPIGGVARALALSPRQLERIFRREVGLPPKHYARLLRFRRMVGALDRGSPRWADLAARAGYSDQSHLVREFRAFAGVAPGMYLAEQTPFAAALLG